MLTVQVRLKSWLGTCGIITLSTTLISRSYYWVETDCVTDQTKLPMSSSLESATRSMALLIFLSTEVSLVLSY